MLKSNTEQFSNARNKADQYLEETFQESMAIKQAFFKENREMMVKGAEALGKAVESGNKVLIFGNGGSAADAQHMAAEMVGRMLLDRRPLPAIALTTDSSNLTAIGNDFGYDQIFLKQIQALARPGDVVIAISTSGNSKNVLIAAQEALDRGCVLVTLTGQSGGKLMSMGHVQIHVGAGKNSSRVQESHIFAIHSLVDLMDRFFITSG